MSPPERQNSKDLPRQGLRAGEDYPTTRKAGSVLPSR
jgi:hypothetical protein